MHQDKLLHQEGAGVIARLEARICVHVFISYWPFALIIIHYFSGSSIIQFLTVLTITLCSTVTHFVKGSALTEYPGSFFILNMFKDVLHVHSVY